MRTVAFYWWPALIVPAAPHAEPPRVWICLFLLLRTISCAKRARES